MMSPYSDVKLTPVKPVAYWVARSSKPSNAVVGLLWAQL